ncbi:MAG: alpha/beta hydrolase, partial [Pseudomonadota bacterium]
MRRLIVKTLLKLPGPWLVKLSGGKPLERRGRTLDPVFQFLNHAARKNPPLSAAGPARARDGVAAGLAMVSGPPDEGISWTEQTVPAPSPARDIPVRIYRPESQDPNAPIIVFAHFGGGVVGDLETSHAFCTRLARIVRCP